MAEPFCWLALAGSEGGAGGGAPGLKRREEATVHAELGAPSVQSSILGGTLGGLVYNSKRIG